MTPALCVVLTALSDNDYGAGFISIKRLAEMLGRERRAVTYALARAVGDGLLRVEDRPGDTKMYWPALFADLAEAKIFDLVDALSSKPAERGRPLKTRATRVHPISENQRTRDSSQVCGSTAKTRATEPPNPCNPSAPNSDDRSTEGWDQIAALSDVERSALIETFEEAWHIWARSDPGTFDRVGFTKIIATFERDFRRRNFAAEHIAEGLFEAAQEMLLRAPDSKGGSFKRYCAKVITTKVEETQQRAIAPRNPGSTAAAFVRRSRRVGTPIAGDPAVQQAIAIYNQAAERHNFYRCVNVTPARVSCIARRLKDIGGLEKWQLALDAACQDDWLMGRTCREGQEPFKLTIDRLLSTRTAMGDLLASLLDRQDPANQQPRRQRCADAARLVAWA